MQVISILNTIKYWLRCVAFFVRVTLNSHFNLSNLTGSVGKSGLGSKSTSQDVINMYGEHARDKRYLITGVTSGIGEECAYALAKAGAKLVLVIRPSSNADDLIEKLRDIRKSFCKKNHIQYIDEDIRVERFDASLVGKIREMVLKFPSNYLDGLLLNAGVMATKERRNNAPEHRELQWATNFLYPCTLAKLAVDESKMTNKARVVFVSSMAHAAGYPSIHQGPIRMHDTLAVDHYDAWSAYGQSKLAQILFARAWNQRDLVALPVVDADKHVSVYLCHPGVVSTKITRELPSYVTTCMSFFSSFMKSVEQGAATQLTALIAPSDRLPTSGSYMADCNKHKTTDFVAEHPEIGQHLLKSIDDLTAPLSVGGRAGDSPVRQAYKQRDSHAAVGKH